jgi:hypothetical protein
LFADDLKGKLQSLFGRNSKFVPAQSIEVLSRLADFRNVGIGRNRCRVG